MYRTNQPRQSGRIARIPHDFNFTPIILAVVLAALPFAAEDAAAQRSYASASEMAALPDVFQSDSLTEPLRGAFDDARETGREIDDATWRSFSARLVNALTGEHEALKADAMRLVIQYGEFIDVDRAAFELVRVYRDHENDNMRRLAVVAIAASGNGWATNFLKRSIDYEKSAAVRHTIVSALAEKGLVTFRPIGPAVQVGMR